MFVGPASGHPGHDAVSVEVAANASAETKSRVSIRIEGDQRIVESNGLPDHETGRFPNRGNPNAISAQEYRLHMPATPVANERPTIARGRFGVALNGVVFDPATAEFWRNSRALGWNYEALTGHLDLGLDRQNAHVQPTGAYHYHGIPAALASDLETRPRMLHVGYAADGFPIYAKYGYREADDCQSGVAALRSSYQLKQGNRPDGERGPGGKFDGTFSADFEYVAGSGDLDECNGRFGVTPEHPEGTYYYVLTEDFPFIPRMFRGTPDPSFEHRAPDGGRGRPSPLRGRRGTDDPARI